MKSKDFEIRTPFQELVTLFLQKHALPSKFSGYGPADYSIAGLQIIDKFDAITTFPVQQLASHTFYSLAMYL